MAMRRPGGFLFGFSPEQSRPTECDTFTCRHCQRVTFVRGKERAEDLGGFCRACASLICPRCVEVMRNTMLGCDVIENKLERSERTQRSLQLDPRLRS